MPNNNSNDNNALNNNTVGQGSIGYSPDNNPVVNNVQSVVNNSQPVVDNVQLVVNNSQPVVDNVQPVMNNTQSLNRFESLSVNSENLNSSQELSSGDIFNTHNINYSQQQPVISNSTESKVDLNVESNMSQINTVKTDDYENFNKMYQSNNSNKNNVNSVKQLHEDDAPLFSRIIVHFSVLLFILSTISFVFSKVYFDQELYKEAVKKSNVDNELVVYVKKLFEEEVKLIDTATGESNLPNMQKVMDDNFFDKSDIKNQVEMNAGNIVSQLLNGNSPSFSFQFKNPISKIQSSLSPRFKSTLDLQLGYSLCVGGDSLELISPDNLYKAKEDGKSCNPLRKVFLSSSYNPLLDEKVSFTVNMQFPEEKISAYSNTMKYTELFGYIGFGISILFFLLAIIFAYPNEKFAKTFFLRIVSSVILICFVVLFLPWLFSNYFPEQLADTVDLYVNMDTASGLTALKDVKVLLRTVYVEFIKLSVMYLLKYVYIFPLVMLFLSSIAYTLNRFLKGK